MRHTFVLAGFALIGVLVVACSGGGGTTDPRTASFPPGAVGRFPPPRTSIPHGLRDCGEDLVSHHSTSHVASDCFEAAFTKCESATARVDLYTIEGDPIAYDLTVAHGSNACEVRVHVHSDDRFGRQGDFDGTCSAIVPIGGTTDGSLKYRLVDCPEDQYIPEAF